MLQPLQRLGVPQAYGGLPSNSNSQGVPLGAQNFAKDTPLRSFESCAGLESLHRRFTLPSLLPVDDDNRGEPWFAASSEGPMRTPK